MVARPLAPTPAGVCDAHPVDRTDELRMLADELRVIAAGGIRWTSEDPYNRDRFERALDVALRLFAFTDTRAVEDVKRSVLAQLTHVAPAPCGDAAVFDDCGRILLIQRADDHLWAMPGGAFEMGETAAEGVRREAREETGVEVEVVDLAGVYDSRFCETRSSIQLYQFVFLCRPIEFGAATTPQEVLDLGWFAETELPALSPGHTVRVPGAFRFLRDRRTFWDRP